jgi:LysM repeat protein
MTNYHIVFRLCVVDLQLSVKSLPITSKAVSSQWPKEKGQKDKQRSAKHTHKTKDRVTRTSLKAGGELRCSGRWKPEKTRCLSFCPFSFGHCVVCPSSTYRL